MAYDPFNPRAYGLRPESGPFDAATYGFKPDGQGQGGVYLPFGVNGGYMSAQDANGAADRASAAMAKRHEDFIAAQPHTRTQRMMAGQGDPYAAMARPWAQGPGGPGPGTIPAMGRGRLAGNPQMAGMFGHNMPAPPQASFMGPKDGTPIPPSAHKYNVPRG